MEDISLIPSFNQSQPTNCSANIPWVNHNNNCSTTRVLRGVTRARRGRQTLSQMSATTTAEVSINTNSNLTTAMNSNPIPPNFDTDNNQGNQSQIEQDSHQIDINE